MASIEDMTDEELLAMTMPGERGYVVPALRDPLLQKRTDVIDEDIDPDDILSKSMDAEPVYKIGEPDIEDGFVDRVSRGAERVGRGVGDLVYQAHAAKTKALMDPVGAAEEAKQFASRVMEGDPEAQEQALIATSMSMVEPMATGADVELARRDVRKAMETRDPGDIATAGVSTVFAAIPLVGVGLTKGITKAAPDPEVLENLSDLKGNKPKLNEDGTITMYHRTSPESAAEIRKTGKFLSKENTNEVFLSSSPTGQAGGYGSEVVEVRVDPAKVRLDDAFDDEIHVAVKVDDIGKPSIAGPEPVFESLLEKAVVEKMPNKVAVDDVEKFLNRKGATKSEIADTKVPEFVDQAKAEGKKSVTKDEVIQHLDENKVQIKEVRLGKSLQKLPKEIEDLSDQRSVAFESLNDEATDLARVLAPDESAAAQVDKLLDNPNHFDILYRDYVKSSNEIWRFENVPPDVREAVNGLTDINYQIVPEDWRPEDAARITKARNVINAKLADPEYQKFFDQQYEDFRAGPAAGFDEDSLAQATQNIEQRDNLRKIARILNKMPEAETRLAALRQFQASPKYQEYSRLSKDFREKYSAFQNDSRKLTPVYERYSVPHGDNYQEILLTVPVPKGFREEQAFVDADDMSKVFRGSHHKGIPNVMVHIRTKDRFDHKGRKILFVEEIQSDWHQKGRNVGYFKNDGKDVEVFDTKTGKVKARFATEEEAKSYAYLNDPNMSRLDYERLSDSDIRKMVPDAPLKDTKEWTSLAVRRVFREAADKGYDGVAFSRADMITPVVTLPEDQAFEALGDRDSFISILSEMRQRGGQYARAADEAEGVFKGNEYYYDKLLPSIAKKESKGDLGTTLIELKDVGFSKVKERQTPGMSYPQFNKQVERLVDSGLVQEVPFFELTPKVKEKVSKPQKLYSLALPAVAVGAAAAEEEELSAAAALGAIGMGGMALYKGARGARDAGFHFKLEKKSIDDIDEVLPEIQRVSDLNQAEIDKYADFRGKFMAQAASFSDRKFSDKEIEVLIDPFRSDAVRELSKTNPNIYGDLLTELRRAAAEDDRVADYLDRASAMHQMTKGGDAAGDIAGSLSELRRELKQYNPENLAESRKALDEAVKALDDYDSELRAAEDALKELEATRPEIVLRGEPGYDEWSDAVRKWNRANVPKRSALQKEIERITGDSYIEHTMQRGRFGSKLRNFEFQLDKARERVETLEKGPLENDNVRYYLDSLKDSVRGINSPDLEKETRNKIRRIIDDIEANVATAGAKPPTAKITPVKTVKTIGQNKVTSSVFSLPGGKIEVFEDSPFAPNNAHSIYKFVVDESRRGQGIGSQLVDEVLRAYPDKEISAQVSSLASLKVLHNKGFRHQDTDMEFDDLAQLWKDEGGSLNMRRAKPPVTDVATAGAKTVDEAEEAARAMREDEVEDDS